jgi:hypothetical protein
MSGNGEIWLKTFALNCLPGAITKEGAHVTQLSQCLR